MSDAAGIAALVGAVVLTVAHLFPLPKHRCIWLVRAHR